MGRRDTTAADLDFFHALLDDGIGKAAADLAPETAEALGVKTVSPSILSQLEEQAGADDSPAQQAQAETQAEDNEPEQEEGSVQGEPQQPEEAVEAFDVGGAPAIDEEPVLEEGEEPAPEPELPSRTTHGKMFTDRRGHPLQMFDILNMRYGEDWAEWEPDTLWWALRRDFGPVGEIARNKIQALSLAAVTDVPWLDWDTFENCGQAWNDFVPIFGAFQPMTPMQVAFTVQVLRGIRADEEFAWEVKAYIAAVLDDHGWVYAPEEWFDGAQEVLDRKEWTVGMKLEVRNAWEQIQHVPPEEIEWDDKDPIGVHLLKLFVVKRYLEGREALRQEVPGVSSSSVTQSPPVP